MTDHAPPSADPADDDSLAGVLRSTFRKFMQQTDDMLPAKVLAFDRATNRATVAPLVSVLTTAGQTVSRAQVASVPVMQFGGGGIVLNFNLKPGDLGWIKASDRDLSLFLQAYKEAQPNTLRMHTFQDGVFIPEVMHGWAIQGEDALNAVLQTLDGNCRVAVGDAFLKLTFGGHSVKLSAAGIDVVSSVHVNVTTPQVNVTAADSVTVTATNAITLQAPSVSLKTSSGAGTQMTLGPSGVNMLGGLTIDGVTFGTHKHTEHDGPNTGGPHA